MSRQRVLMVVAVLAPLVAVAAVVPFRASIANTNAALFLVLVVVAVAANGMRWAGAVAALSAGVWFDFFLTQPYQELTITNRADIETTLLLLLVGIAVTELAVWGRRQQAEVSRRAGYEQGILAAVESISDEASSGTVIGQVCDQLTRILHLQGCRFDYAEGVVGGDHPRLRADGQVEVHGATCDVERFGLPTDHDIELLLTSDTGYHGRFVMTASPDSHPSLAQRLAALTLAERANAALAGHRGQEQR